MGERGTSVFLIIKGTPVAKQSTKFGRYHAYTPKRITDQEDLIRATYLENGGKILNGAIEAEYEFIYEPPKSLSKRKQLRLMGMPKLTRPDTDNLVKLCQDALNGVAYTDDNRVWKITTRKVFGPEAMTVIRLKEADVEE